MEGDDPVTLAVAAAGAGLAATSAIGGGMQAKSAALQQGRQDTEEASVARMQAGAEISNDTENAGHELSTVAARAGSMGVTAGSATPILSEDFSHASIKAAYTRFTGNEQASEDIYAAKLSKYQGQQAMWAGLFKAGTAVLGSASSLAGSGAFNGSSSGSPPLTVMSGNESMVN